MPLYFFHVRGGSLESDDADGIELPNDAAAYAKALHGARSIIAAEVLDGRLPLGERIDVTDRYGRLAFVLAFADAVE